MVLHCIVIAFLALGAAILTAHDRALLGWIALIGMSQINTHATLFSETRM